MVVESLPVKQHKEHLDETDEVSTHMHVHTRTDIHTHTGLSQGWSGNKGSGCVLQPIGLFSRSQESKPYLYERT